MDYSMPAEWEPHSAIWLAWPHDEIAFPGRVEKVENDFVKIIGSILDSEKVELLVLDESMKEKALSKLKTAGLNTDRITFHTFKYLGGWMRDCCGIFVKDSEGKQSLVKWIFNTWGNKFPDLQIDAEIPDKVAEWSGFKMLSPALVLEGGAIDVDGKGTLLTTEQCLLNPNRNPGKTKEDYEKYLGDYLGIKKIIWLKQGLINDHTDGHIDDIARFVGPAKVVCAFESSESDVNYDILKKNYEDLYKATDVSGQALEVIKLPMAHMNYDTDKPFEGGGKVPATYCNFYIGNTVVLAPIYEDPNDAEALQILTSLFPGKKVIGIDCRDIVYGGGAIHCLSQQQPAV